MSGTDTKGEILMDTELEQLKRTIATHAEAIDAISAALAKVQMDFAHHFHGADELREFTDPPIVPVEMV